MINILYQFFIGKIILMALIIGLIYFYKNKKVHPLLLTLGIIFLSFVGFSDFCRPNIISSTNLYNEFINLTPEKVKNIVLYDEIKTVVYKIADDKKAQILMTLKQNKSYLPNHPVYINTYLLEINTYNYDDKIYFEIIETENNGILVNLLNFYNKELQPIGTYQNNNLLNSFLSSTN